MQPKEEKFHFQRAARAAGLGLCHGIGFSGAVAVALPCPWVSPQPWAISKCAGWPPVSGTIRAVLNHRTLAGLRWLPGVTSDS